jgi:Carboxypeptidase regulatory-like domain
VISKSSRASFETHGGDLAQTSGRILALILCALIASVGGWAQTGEVSLRGQVTDPSGAAVAGVPIMLTGPDGATREAQTDDSEGRYVFRGLPFGTYILRIHVKGFADFERTGIQIAPGRTQVQDVKLVVTMENQEVTVRDEDTTQVSVSPGNNASALVLSGADDLASLSDDPTDLQADLQALAGPSAGPSGGSIYVNGFSGGNLPSKDSIREIRINQNPFSPEYDKLGYGRIEIFTKPGTEKYHGTVDYNVSSDIWNSRNPYGSQKAPFLLRELEGGAGGPLAKRASFAFNFQRNSVDNGSIANGVTLDPTTLAITPFNETLKTPQRFLRLNPRVDYQLNDNNTLIVSYESTNSNITDAGIGGYDVISRGYHSHYLDQTVQITETAVLGRNINETRLQYFRTANQIIPNDLSPEIQVLGSFRGGGSQIGQSSDTQNNFELQNYTSMIRSAQTWRFGIRVRAQAEDSLARQNFNGTFTFGGGLAPALDANNQPLFDASGQPVLTRITSIERYRRTLLFQQLSFSPMQVQALGGGARQFSIDTGIPQLSARQIDIGVFGGDEWKVRPNVTLNLGFRYETQTNIHDWRDFAPRIAVAWAPGGGAQNLRAKTVLRAGVGTFYDRFPLANTILARRYNAAVQHQYVLIDPTFFPNVPATTAIAPLAYDSVQEVSSRMRGPYVIQSALSLERQLPANTALAITYTYSHGVHLFRSKDINAPLPGTFNPNVQGSGVFPFGVPGPVFLMESSGIYNQNQLIANINTRVNQGVSLFGFYVLNHAMSNTDGIGTFPANPYNPSGEYGPASTDVRHRVTVGGSINMRWSVRISPFVIVQSGAPFDITTGEDIYGTTLFNARPGIATNPAAAGVIPTRYGLLDPNPSAGEQIIRRNSGRGPSQFRVNLRLSKAIGFGSEHGSNTGQGQGAGAPRGATSEQASGRGLGSLIGNPKTVHRYNLIFSISAQNILNHNNPGPINGDITSPLFGLSNQIAGGPNGEGFFETANNRRLEMQTRFTF